MPGESHQQERPLDQSALARRRKSLGLTQADVGRAVLTELGRPEPTKGYAQKLLSLWEAGRSRPDSSQIQAYAKVLRTDEATIRAELPRVTSAAIELFNGLRYLAGQGVSSIVLACVSSQPKAVVDPDTFDAVADALKAGVAFALVVPYPTTLRAARPSPARERLRLYYDAVRADVVEYAAALKARAGEHASKVAVLIPKELSELTADIPLYPPHQERPVLVIKSSSDQSDRARHQKELYFWIKTADIDELRPAAPEAADNPISQLRVWEAYFREIADVWSVHRSLAPNEFIECEDWTCIDIGAMT
jgi:transcriptional regulator with XRE-family HTH domain